MRATEIFRGQGKSRSGGEGEDRFQAVGRIELSDTRREPRVLADAPQEAESLSHALTAGSIKRHGRNRSVLAGMSEP
jgi:hypothetical protein